MVDLSLAQQLCGESMELLFLAHKGRPAVSGEALCQGSVSHRETGGAGLESGDRTYNCYLHVRQLFA